MLHDYKKIIIKKSQWGIPNWDRYVVLKGAGRVNI